MVKYWVFLEGQRKYLNQFEEHLSNRVYNTQLPNMPGTTCKPIINEIRLYDISVFETCAGTLMDDIRPFQSIDLILPKWTHPIVSFIRKMFGLYTFKGQNKIIPDGAEKPKIKSYVIGCKDDVWINGVEMI